jgi:acyl carrier protein
MKTRVTAQAVIAVVERVLSENQIDMSNLSQSQDLLETGVIDSLVVVDLAMELEEAFDFELDFDALDSFTIESLVAVIQRATA